MTLCLWAILLHVSTDKSFGKIPRRKFWKYSLFLYIFHSIYCPLISSCCQFYQLYQDPSACEKAWKWLKVWFESIVRTAMPTSTFQRTMTFVAWCLISYILFDLFLFGFLFQLGGYIRVWLKCLFHHPSGTLIGWINELMDHKTQSYWIEWNSKPDPYLL